MMVKESHSNIHSEEKEAPLIADSSLQRIIIFVQQKDSVDAGNLMERVDELRKRNSAYDSNSSMDDLSRKRCT